jgi:hypothetical protein
MRDHNIHSHSATAFVSLPTSQIPPKVEASERSTTKGSSLIGIGAECLSARTSERSPAVPNTHFTRRLSHIVLAFHLCFLPESTLESTLPPTFLVDWDRCRAPAYSNIDKIAHRSRHPFHEAHPTSSLAPSTDSSRSRHVRALTYQHSSLLGISAEFPPAQTSDKSPIIPDTCFIGRLSAVLFYLAPPCVEAPIELVEHFYP